MKAYKTTNVFGENKMTRNEAKLELFKVNRQIEKKIVEHKNELGQYNKSIVMDELQLLWDRKDILKNFVNS
tara:strand:- start:640 stop:852 length:213 start_codon:yes stop_codon:yes gene_type:complete